MEIVEIFKTNVLENEQADYLIASLLAHFPQHKINFDLQDCDKILRVQGKNVCSEKIIELVNTSGYQCSVLD